MSISQNARLLAYLMHNNSITQLEAMSALGILRLSERCRELEARGFIIRHDRISVPTRTGKAAHVMRYSLVSQPESVAA